MNKNIEYYRELEKIINNVIPSLSVRIRARQLLGNLKECIVRANIYEDKETPKKTKRLYYTCHNSECDKTKTFIYYCPVCNISVDEDMNYCPECSQKLDWSGQDD